MVLLGQPTPSRTDLLAGGVRTEAQGGERIGSAHRWSAAQLAELGVALAKPARVDRFDGLAARAETPPRLHRGMVVPAGQRGGLHGCAGGNRLIDAREHEWLLEQPGQDRTECGRLRPTTGQDDPAGHLGMGPKCVERVDQPAGDAVHGGERELLACHIAAQAADSPVASGRFGVRSPSK